jgi:predicted naringenin-chalcone synthase
MPRPNTVNTCISAIATAVPDGKISQGQAAIQAALACGNTPKQAALVGHLFKRAGISRRSASIYDSNIPGAPPSTFFHYYDPDKPHGPSTSDRMSRYQKDSELLAGEAGRSVLRNAEISPSQFTHIVTVSCTGFAAPGFDLALVDSLGLTKSINRTHLGFMGCHGALNGLRVARAFVEADPNNIVLLCAVELCSLHFQYDWEPNSIVANSLFADGAAALVVRSADEADTGLCKLQANGSFIVENTTGAITWQIGNHGFLMKLSAELPEIISDQLPQWMDSWLSQYGLSVGDINSWAIHPGGKRVLDAVESCLALSVVKMLPSRLILSEYGNMSSPTVLFILRHLLDTQLKLPCVMLGFGPGLTIEAALLS